MQKSKYRDLRLGLQSSIYKQTKLFKKYNYPSWGIDRNINTPGEKVFIKKDTPATNWFKFIRLNQIAGIFGKGLKKPGYIVNRYKRGFGIKGATIFKPKQPVLNPDLIADKSKPAWIQKTL